MKARTEIAVLVVVLTLGAADERSELTRGMPAPPPHFIPRRLPMVGCPELVCPQVCPMMPPCPNLSCPEPVCPQPACPPVRCSPCPDCHPAAVSCPQPVCPPLPPALPCPNLSCPEPVCPAPTCPKPACSCSPCPSCPDCRPANLSCPQPVCPPAVCPRPKCPSLTAPTAQACPAKGASCTGCLWKVLVNYDHFQGFGFYKAYKTKVDWHQAKALCAADGGHLGIINSDEEAKLFKLLYQKNELTGWIFIGFHDLNEENKFETVMGEPLSKTGYMKWRPDQPDNAGNEDCGTIDENALLNDGRCDWKIGFICEVHEKKALGQ